MREHTQLQRRELLAASGAVASGSTAGCTSVFGDGGSPARESPAQQQQQQSDGTTFDALQAGSIDAGAVSADELNSVVSVSPGDDLEAKVEEVPNGGSLFFEAGRHDVTEMGTVTANKVISIFMAGGTSGSTNPVGAVLENTGDGALDEPVITLTSPSPNPQDQERQWGSMLWNPTIVHHGDAPAIDVHHSPMSNIYKPEIQLGFEGRTGIGLTSWSQSWGLQIHGGRIRAPAEYGIEDRSAGGLKILDGMQILHGHNNVSMRARRGWFIRDTDFACGIGLQLIGNANYVRGPRSEAVNTAIQVGPASDRGGDTRHPDAKIDGPAQNNIIEGGSFMSEKVTIEFDHAEDCMVWNPIKLEPNKSDGRPPENPDTTAPGVRWTENSTRCSVVGRRTIIDNNEWDMHDGATHPVVDYVTEYKMDGEARSNITQPVEGMSVWSPEHNSPVYYNGEEWMAPSMTPASR
jgi:hypothetical protein